MQFLQLWARSAEAPGGNDPGYGQVKNLWAAGYGYYAAKGLAQNGDGYKNDVEKWAKNKTFDVLTQLSRSTMTAKEWQLCGFSFYGTIQRPDY